MRRFLATVPALGFFCVVTTTVPAQDVMTMPEKKEGTRHAVQLDAGKLGKEMFSAKENGIKVRVWLVTRADHEKLISEQDAAGMRSKETGKQSGRTGSPHEVAVVMMEDVLTNATIDDATVELTFTSPAKKADTVALTFLHGHYSNSVALTEKGSYQTELRIKRNGRTTTLKFNTTVMTI